MQVDIFPLEETFGPVIHRFSARLSNVLINKMIERGYINLARVGYILGHNVTFPLLRILSKLNPNNKLMYPLGASWLKIFDEKIFQERSLYKFEGYSFYGPKNFDKHLSSSYGDYMNLPSIDKRDNHQATYVIYD